MQMETKRPWPRAFWLSQNKDTGAEKTSRRSFLAGDLPGILATRARVSPPAALSGETAEEAEAPCAHAGRFVD